MMKGFFRRQAIIPFETATAAFCVFTGIAGILDFGIVNVGFQSVLGRPISLGFNIAYILAGLGLYFGIGLNRRNLEAFGVILIAMSLLVRSIALLHYAGLSPIFISVHIYSAGFVVACAVRLGFLLSGKMIVEADTLSDLFAQLEKLKSQIPNRVR